MLTDSIMYIHYTAVSVITTTLSIGILYLYEFLQEFSDLYTAMTTPSISHLSISARLAHDSPCDSHSASGHQLTRATDFILRFKSVVLAHGDTRVRAH